MKNYGFPEHIEIKPEEWLLGSIKGNALKADGDWSDYLPKYEPQADKYETGGCTVWGGQNQIEILLKFLTGTEFNFSERFNYILAEVKSPEGQQPSVTYETFRKNGLIPADLLPTTNTYKEFCTPKPMTELYLVKGKEWLGKWEYNHEWVLDGNSPRQTEILKDSLKYSPVAVSVTGWTKKGDVYVDRGVKNNHWCVLFKFDGDKPVVFDSYDHSIKTLDPKHQITYAKIISLKPKPMENETVTKNLMKQVIALLTRLKNYLVANPNAKPTDIVPEMVTEPVAAPTPAPKYDWSTPMKARHSVRVICDEEKLTLAQKNELCATIGAESGWKPRAIGAVNFDGTRDYGIVQINPKYWIGPGKKFPSIDYVLDNPEACVRWMCREWKAGNKNWWYGFKNGSYKKYL